MAPEIEKNTERFSFGVDIKKTLADYRLQLEAEAHKREVAVSKGAQHRGQNDDRSSSSSSEKKHPSKQAEENPDNSLEKQRSVRKSDVSSAASMDFNVAQSSQESSGKRASGSLAIVSPGPRDILFGRGRAHKNRPGHAFMQKLVSNNRTEYDNANSREVKTELASSIVKAIQSSGGRFLKMNKARKCWLIVSDEEARFKVSHAMRDARAKELHTVVNTKKKSTTVSTNMSQQRTADTSVVQSTDDSQASSLLNQQPQQIHQNTVAGGMQKVFLLRQLLSSPAMAPSLFPASQPLTAAAATIGRPFGGASGLNLLLTPLTQTIVQQPRSTGKTKNDQDK